MSWLLGSQDMRNGEFKPEQSKLEASLGNLVMYCLKQNSTKRTS